MKGQPCTFSGVHEDFDDTYYALCTSTETVRDYVEQGCYTLFKEAPGLGGAFCITASESHTHCYSHYPKHLSSYVGWNKLPFECPRCADREPSDVVAELITIMNRGIKAASPKADLMVWTWSWAVLEPDPQPNVIAKLPKDVILMSDWERGGTKKVLGKTYPLDEYSLSSIGPSPRYMKQLNLARQRGMRMAAKIQIGATHEFCAVPYLPLPVLLAEKFRRIAKAGVDGYLGCWIFGGDVSPMSKLAGKMSRKPAPEPTVAVKELAVEEYGEQSAASVVKAWKHFAKAWKEYPFTIPLIYMGPMNYAPAYPLHLKMEDKPFAASWLRLPRDAKGHLDTGCNFDNCLGPFTVEIINEAFELLLKEWDLGIEVLQKAVEKGHDNEALKKELSLDEHISLSLRSTINIFRFCDNLRKLRKTNSAKTQSTLRRRMKQVLEAEILIVAREKELLHADPRLGYHSEAHMHLFTKEDLDYKMGLVKRTIKELSLSS